MKHPSDTEQRSLVEDWLKTLWLLQFVIHALAWPFRLIWVRPGCIGRRAYGWDFLAGLLIGFPAYCQWPSSPQDVRLSLRAWHGLYYLAVVQVLASWLLNRRNRHGPIHSREIGTKAILPGGVWSLISVAVLANFCLRPSFNGIGTFLTYSPLAYLLSNWFVELRMRHPVTEVDDAEIAGRDFQRRVQRR